MGALSSSYYIFRLLTIKEPIKKVPYAHNMIFHKEWLDLKDEDDEQGRTNRETMTEVSLRDSKIFAPWKLIDSL